MKRCSETAYSICAFAKYCGAVDDAVFVDGSECDMFNEEVERLRQALSGLIGENMKEVVANLVGTIGEALDCAFPVWQELLSLSEELQEVSNA